MSKYGPLADFLGRASGSEVPMTFTEIERVIGHALPASKKYPAWWSNNPSNNVMTQVWLSAGFQTERVDVSRQRLVFRRVSGAASSLSASGDGPGLLQRIQARLAGTVTVAPGVDLTAPVSDVWDAER